jgi:hypothetical protein
MKPKQKIANRFFENMVKLKYFGNTTNQNCTQEKIKSRINLESACCHSVLNLLSIRYEKR